MTIKKDRRVLGGLPVRVSRSNIAAEQIRKGSQLLIAFETDLRLFDGSVTQGKGAIQDGSHDSKDAQCENDLDQGEPAGGMATERTSHQGFPFLTRRRVLNSTRLSLLDSGTMISSAISFSSQSLPKLSSLADLTGWT